MSKFSTAFASICVYLLPSFLLAQGISPRLGENWDRIEAIESPQSQVVFKLTFPMVASYGTATYVGNFNGLDLFITAKHVTVSGCELLYLENKFLKTDYQMECDQIIFSHDTLDVTILSAKIKNPELSKRLHSLKPAKLTTAPVGLRTRLHIVGYGSFNNDKQTMTEQDDETCTTLIPFEPRLIKGPPIVNNNSIWSMPVGCDASHGDSGAPAFIKGTNKIAGIFWATGARGSDISNANLIRAFEVSPERLWRDFSFIVPAPIIVKEIKSKIESATSTQLDSRALSALTDLLNSQLDSK